MSSACTPIMMGSASPVSEILLPSKMAKFPFLTMGYSPWSSKNLIDRNRLKNSCKYGLMSSACTPIMVGGASPVSEICLIFHFRLAIVILLLMHVFPHSLPLLYLQIKSDIKRRHTLLPKSFSDAASSNSISSFIMSSNPMKVIRYLYLAHSLQLNL